ncbi:MAG: sigma factor [Chloroflexales bacterium]
MYADEAALLAGLRRHDPDACTCLVKRFAPLVYARALRLVGDPDDAEGVLQTTFIKTCDALPNFDGASSLGTWIYRIATNEGLMLLRQRRDDRCGSGTGTAIAERSSVNIKIPHQ